MEQRGPLRDKSGSITTGATAQDVATADGGRKYFFFQNISDTDMHIDFGSTAVADEPAILVPATDATNHVHGGIVEFTTFVPTDRVSVICATTGKKFVCKVG